MHWRSCSCSLDPPGYPEGKACKPKQDGKGFLLLNTECFQVLNMFVIFKHLLNLKPCRIHRKNFLSGCCQIVGNDIPALCVLLFLWIGLFGWRWGDNQPHFVAKQSNCRVFCMQPNCFRLLLFPLFTPSECLSLFDTKIQEDFLFEQKFHDNWYPKSSIKHKSWIKPKASTKLFYLF